MSTRRPDICSTTRPFALFIALLAAQASAGTFTVTNNNDSGAGSLRQALLNANANVDLDSIVFQIGSGAKTIQLASKLPDIDHPTFVDARTQPGYAGVPLIRIDGALAGSNVGGLRIYAGPTTVQGLIITSFDGPGITTGGGDSIVIRGCYIGTTGNASGLGNSSGIRAYQGSNISIGWPVNGDGNLISGNESSAVYIDPGATSVKLRGNLIGTNVLGTAALPNQSGVRVFSSGTVIGGDTAVERNLISGNSGVAISVEGVGTSGVGILGNAIGVDQAGSNAIGNGSGISDFGTGTVIGGAAAGEGNIVSGNSGRGLSLSGSATLVIGNRIGTNATGTAALGNGYEGIAAYGSSISIGNNSLGNLISGNVDDGLYIAPNAVDITVKRNFIGTNAAGTAKIPNAAYGVRAYGAPGSRIGSPGHGNVISGNTGSGIYLGVDASGYIIQGNIIGLASDGSSGLRNEGSGIDIYSEGGLIGGSALGAFNRISDNARFGLYLGAGANDNTIQGNYIGTNIALATDLGNWFGIYMDGANSNTIGGFNPGQGNVIAGSVNQGVMIQYGSGNHLLRNTVFGNGAAGIDLYPQGPSANDALDIDLGVNQGQNYPLVRSAAAAAGAIEVSGTLASAANGSFLVEFFWSSTCHYSGFGQGEVYLGAIDVMTDAVGHGQFDIAFANAANNGYVTATATAIPPSFLPVLRSDRSPPASSILRAALCWPTKI